MGTGAKRAECKEFSRRAVVLREGLISELLYQGDWYQSGAVEYRVDCLSRA
jgi:hypothetical protein